MQHPEHQGTPVMYTLHAAQVREAILTSALLRLPGTMSRAQKEHRVDQILAELARLCQYPILQHFPCNARLLLRHVSPYALQGGQAWHVPYLPGDAGRCCNGGPHHGTSHAGRQPLLAVDR